MNKQIFGLVVVVLLMAGAMAADSSATTQINTKLNNIVSLVQSIAVAIAIVVLAFGGLKFMTAANDPMAKDQAKQIMMGAIIGLIVILAAPEIIHAVAGI